MLKRSGDCVTMLEGSVVQDLSLIQSRKTCHISHLWISCYIRERWFKNKVTNWHSTNDKIVTNNHTTAISIIIIMIMITIVKVLIIFRGWLKNNTKIWSRSEFYCCHHSLTHSLILKIYVASPPIRESSHKNKWKIIPTNFATPSLPRG